MNGPEFLKQPLLEKFQAEELLAIGQKFMDARPGAEETVGDVLKRIASSQAEFRRLDVGLTLITKHIPLNGFSIDQIKEITVYGRIDGDGDAADIAVHTVLKAF